MECAITFCIKNRFKSWDVTLLILGVAHSIS